MRTVLKNLSISQKLLLNGLIYILPLAVLLYFTVSGILAGIRSTEQESRGLSVLRPLEDLMQLVPQHRVLVFAQARGGSDVDGRLKEIEKEIDGSFARLLSLSARLGSRLGIDDQSLKQAGMDGAQPVKLKESWGKLSKEERDSIPELSTLEYSNLVAAIRSLIARVGDASGLVLDSELSSYYLAEITVVEIPRVLDQLGELRLLGQQIIYSGQSLWQEFSRLELLVSAIDAGSLQQMQKSLATAVRHDKHARGDLSTIEVTVPLFQKSFDSTRSLLQSALALNKLGSGSGVQDFLTAGSSTADSIGKFKNEALDQLDRLLSDRIERHQIRMYAALGLILFCIGLALIFAFMISRGITKPLADVMSIAGEISVGNIDGARAQIKRLGVEGAIAGADAAELPRFRDEIRQLASVFVHMTDSLHTLVLQVQKSGIQVIASSTEISASSRQLEATAAQQAASTNQVNVTAKEISSSCRLLLESTKQVMGVAAETLSLAQEGQNRLAKMKATMDELTRATSSIGSQLDGINLTTGNIGSVITTMTKVADQTNLLSLNATIEAEKAGKYGLGFSVVAREIQRLSDQTAVATLDIERQVRTMEATVSAGLAEMDGFVRQVQESVREVETISSELVSSMIEHLNELMPRFEEVGSAMDAQSTGADEISNAIRQLSEGAEQTREVIRDFSSVARQLTRAAGELQEEVSRFNATSATDEQPV